MKLIWPTYCTNCKIDLGRPCTLLPFSFSWFLWRVLAFYAIQYAAQAGWSPVLFRVMEGITAYLPVASVIILYCWCFPLRASITSSIGWTPIWSIPKVSIMTKSLQEKAVIWTYHSFGSSGSVPFGWNLYRYFSKNSVADDTAENHAYFKKEL